MEPATLTGRSAPWRASHFPYSTPHAAPKSCNAAADLLQSETMKLTWFRVFAFAALSFAAGSWLTARFVALPKVQAPSNQIYQLRPQTTGCTMFWRRSYTLGTALSFDAVRYTSVRNDRFDPGRRYPGGPRHPGQSCGRRGNRDCGGGSSRPALRRVGTPRACAAAQG